MAKSVEFFVIVLVCVCMCVIGDALKSQRVQVVRFVRGGIGFGCCRLLAFVEIKFRCILLGVLSANSTRTHS